MTGNLSTCVPNPVHWYGIKPDLIESRRPFSKAPYFTELVSVNMFERIVEFTSPFKEFENPPPPIREKNDIQSFSKNSRSRLIKLFAQTSFRSYSKMYFLTLTYHEDFPQEFRAFKIQLDRFLKMIRRLDSNLAWIWRLEFQERGAPHYHLVLFWSKKSPKVSELTLKNWVTKAWLTHKACRCEDCQRYSTKLTELDTFKKGFNYVCKYSAKPDEKTKPVNSGRIWGYSNNLERYPIKKDSIPLAYFQLLKARFLEHFTNDRFKRNYISESLGSVFSFSLYCDSIELDYIFDSVLSLSPRELFDELKARGMLSENYYFDL